jgi:hypothetical protein
MSAPENSGLPDLDAFMKSMEEALKKYVEDALSRHMAEVRALVEEVAKRQERSNRRRNAVSLAGSAVAIVVDIVSG